MRNTKVGITAAAVATAGAVAIIGASIAGAADNSSSATPSQSATSSAAAPGGTATKSSGSANQAPPQHTEVSDGVAAKVKAAVKAKDSSVTITAVRQDPDGSFDAVGTKSDGSKMMFDVSKDFATVNEKAGGPGGPGGASQDTAVTGSEADKVKAAVKAKESTVTITEVRMDPDKSYDALGTKSDGSRVFYDVSADLKTVTEHTGGPGGPGGRGGPGAQQPGDATGASSNPTDANG